MKFPGLELRVVTGGTDECSFCGRTDVPLMTGDFVVCEVCSLIVAHAWRLWQGDTDDETAVFPPRPGFVLGLVLRERTGDLRIPFEALMVERKDEPGVFGLPGGKVEPGETAEEALVRELDEEGYVETWPSALESLYSGFSPRARWGKVYIVRAYASTYLDDERLREGEKLPARNPEGLQLGWKPWPLAQHAKHLAALYVGIQEAFGLRWKLQTKLGITSPMSAFMSGPAKRYLNSRLDSMSGVRVAGESSSDRMRTEDGFWHVMTPEEQEAAKYVTEMFSKMRDARAIARLDKQAVLGVTTGLPRHMPVGRPAEEVGEETEPEGEVPAEGEEGGEVEGEESTRPGFARPSGGIRPPRRDE